MGRTRSWSILCLAVIGVGCGGGADTPDSGPGSDAARADAAAQTDARLPDAAPYDAYFCATEDMHEPNDIEAEREFIGFTSDCDDAMSLDTPSGVLAGAADTDWFQYEGTDELCTVDPTVTLSSDSALRVCMFFECVDSEVTLNLMCPMGTTATASADGRSGCCASGSFTVEDVTCGGAILDDDDLRVYIRIDNDGADVCNSYSLTAHF